MLLEIGFWCRVDADGSAVDASVERPDPRQLVDDVWFAAADVALLQQLQWYLTRGAFIESHELAYSFCRFANCSVAQHAPKVMGACTLTDGTYCWPEAYWHYVQCHHVKPPLAFLQHIEANFQQQEQQQQQQVTQGTTNSLLLWDECEQRAMRMPQAMHEWITSHTMLGSPDSQSQ